MAQGKNKKRWLQEHFSDTYVKQAHQLGYRSRAAFKLLEIQKRDKLFKQGSIVIDLGAAPGGWSQVLAPLVGKSGCVIAYDILPIKPIPAVEVIQGDFTDSRAEDSLLTVLENRKADWVISDMAPDMSGIAAVDQIRSIELAQLVLEFAGKVLNDSGGLLIKTFHGEGFEELLKDMRRKFTLVIIRKPDASRSRSKEVYLIARGAKKLS